MSDPHTFHGPKNFRELFAEAEAAAKFRLAEGKSLRLSPEARTDNGEATVWLYDVIGAWFGLDPAVFAREIAAIDAGVIHIRINSPGGVVTDAEVMQTALQQHPAKIIAHIDGYAASAATVVALGADEIEMSDGAWWMIHNAWGVAVGGVEEMLEHAEILEKMNANLAADYMRKTGASESQVRAWMDAETHFTAREALDNGFVDRIYTAPEKDDFHKQQGKASSGKGASARAVRARALSLAGAAG